MYNCADFASYLKLRAAALISDDYQVSDMFWMDVRDNDIDVVIGPIDTRIAEAASAASKPLAAWNTCQALKKYKYSCLAYER